VPPQLCDGSTVIHDICSSISSISSISSSSGNLNQAPVKQSAVCSKCIIPAPPVNCQFIWTASTLGMSAIQPILMSIYLDRTLSYREHLTKTADKLKNRNNLLTKLAGSTRGASANTLWSSALSLCYSAAEYCAPVWSRSIDISQVDVQFISGTLRSTLLPWLPVLSNEERLPLTSWWRKSSNMIVSQSSLISLTHHWHD